MLSSHVRLLVSVRTSGQISRLLVEQKTFPQTEVAARGRVAMDHPAGPPTTEEETLLKHKTSVANLKHGEDMNVAKLKHEQDSNVAKMKDETGPKLEVDGVRQQEQLPKGNDGQLKHDFGSKLKLESPGKMKHEEVVQEVGKSQASEADEGAAGPGNAHREKGQVGKAAVKTEIVNTPAGNREGGPDVLFLAAQTPQEASSARDLLASFPPNLPTAHLVTSREGTEEDGDQPPEFDARKYLGRLQSTRLGRIVAYSRRLPSTHTLLSQNFKSFPVGTVCVADQQYQGRGRAGNSWESPPGCLMFSFTLQTSNGRQLPFVQYIVSLAVVDAIGSVVTSGACQEALGIRIKWPNDLYAKGSIKIGGVLCTSTYTDKLFNVTVGVGLNVANTEPTTCLNALLEEQDPQARPVAREELLAAIMSRFQEIHARFSKNGFDEFRDLYLRRWLHSDQKVELEEGGKDGTPLQRVPLTIKGLTPGGYLLAVDELGASYELSPDGNSLDFFKGLVRKKLQE